MRVPSENVEARALVRWVRMECRGILRIAHIPNETPTTPDIAAKQKSMGVSRGVPDYLIVHEVSHKHIFIELKRRARWKESAEQKAWRRALGKRAYLCIGWHEAAEVIKRELL